MMTRTVERYSLSIVAPETFRFPGTDAEQRALQNLTDFMQAVEEDLTDLLPEGWTAQIRCEEEEEDE